MDQGWIKLHRSIYNHWLWKEDTKLKWWLDLLLMANHTTRKILLGNNLIEIPRGSLHTSITKLTARWQADKKTVKRFLDLLQKDSMISYTTTAQGTTINISNYNDFQNSFKAESPVDAPTLSPCEAPILSPEVPLESPQAEDRRRDSSISIPKDIPRDTIKDNTRDISITSPLDSSITNPLDSTLPTTENYSAVNPIIHAVDNPIPHTLDNPMDTTRVSTEGNPRNTNNNINNNKNLNNAKNGEEREAEKQEKKTPLCPAHLKATLPLESKEVPREAAATTLTPLSFPTPLHKEIHNSLGEVAYRTWFMDAHIASTSQGAILQVDSPFKRDVISSKFKVQLGRILGKIVEVKSA
ncbi:MAG: hypothetical protein RR128_04055 [Clostridium sp.]